MASVYDSERLAAAYARDRPPIHEQILLAARLGRQADCALDIGCGAGLSTAALAPLARRAIGLEPISTMLTHRRTVAPHASSLEGQGRPAPRTLPRRFSSTSSAAGSLNYADLSSALTEIARVLTRDGTFLLYDFSTGRRSVSGDELADWFASFEQRFPWPSGWEPLDVRELPLAAYGLRLLDYTDLEIQLPMWIANAPRYMLSETNVDDAIARGAAPSRLATGAWRRPAVFADDKVTVVVPGSRPLRPHTASSPTRSPHPTRFSADNSGFLGTPWCCQASTITCSPNGPARFCLDCVLIGFTASEVMYYEAAPPVATCLPGR